MSTLLHSDDPRPVHFVGAAGAGMSALAELFVRRGVKVSGCDTQADGSRDLRRLGVTVLQGHDAAHVADSRALVVSSAVPKDHPELVAARGASVPVIRRAEALGEAVSGGELVGVAGTHGKTTTTVLTTEALRSAGMSPTGVAGGRVGRWEGNLSYGGTTLFVVEADEYDRSFLALSPTVAVVTNVEADHLDIYPGGLEDIRQTFSQYVSGARAIVMCADDKGAESMTLPASAEIVRYGMKATSARLRADKVKPSRSGMHFHVRFDDEDLGEVHLAVPGEHNVQNALAAIGAGLMLGATLEGMRPGLASFRGVERRFQRLGEAGGVTIIDDYAHHPTEIRATLDAARAAFPRRRLVAAFQPHLYSRTRDFAEDFAQALSLADAVFLTEIYAAREKPIDGITSDLIGDRMADGRLTWRGSRDDLAGALSNAVKPGDVVLTIGAGDITRSGPELLRRLS